MKFVILNDLWLFILNVGGFDDAELLRVVFFFFIGMLSVQSCILIVNLSLRGFFTWKEDACMYG